MYIIKIKGKAKIPDFIQLRMTTSFSLSTSVQKDQ